jgi:hypothetical protein
MPAGKQTQSGIPNRVENCNADAIFTRTGKESQQDYVMSCLRRIEICGPCALFPVMPNRN